MKELNQKLLKIQKECNYFKKDTKGYNYSFVSGTEILSKIRPMMDDLGLLLSQEALEMKTEYFQKIMEAV